MSGHSDVEPLVLRQQDAFATGEHRALLLHGLGSSVSCWDAFLANSPANLDCWTAALPWRAGGPFAAVEPDQSTWIAEAIGRVPGGFDVVIAHSFATVLLLRLLAETAAAAKDPFTEYGIRAVVLVAPFYRRRADEFTWDELPDCLDRLVLGADEGIRLAGRKSLDPGIRGEMAQRACTQLGPYWVLRHLDAYLRTPFLPVDLIDLPVHVIVGDRDPIAPPTEGEVLAGRLGNASLQRIDHCGHSPMIERPDQFSHAVQEFLATLPAGPIPAGLT
ncbi:alpha/beta fold hydrolase [Amycolatopsis sp. H20-H5]|uniref:alpha/beta fold hydrolase n=1 Tax=Amycolatopsis sp. H20-H5 TaxID=3046309 RepID=UPI002DB99E2D|nr:alpha/beta hydrolase [Amycolatopsis sp. H20-H5]MEC3979483.1 alpha/beta hydrolase [Amycolatopsis sp. H20-H5]